VVLQTITSVLEEPDISYLLAGEHAEYEKQWCRGREGEASKHRALSEPIGVKRILESTVACRDWLLGNDCETNNKTMPAARQQILNKQQLNCNRGTVFSMLSASRCYKQDSWSSESVAGYSPDYNNVSTKAEESPSLRSVTRKRIVKAD
jgi:hypothetical protein